tara:strand:+ start:28 stop:375 length:348 start_codon:yes stop_codon:yes gene_type:complete
MASAALQTLTDIVPTLGDEDKHVRVEALKKLRAVMDNNKLGPVVLAEHAHHIVTRLDDEYWYVRRHAVEALGDLEPGVLAEHAHHIVPRLGDEDWMVRNFSVRALCKLQPMVLAE